MKQNGLRKTVEHPLNLSTTCLLFARRAPGEAPILAKQRSISAASVNLLASCKNEAADNFDLSALNSAISQVEDVKAQVASKRAFLQELEVCSFLS